MFSQHFYEEYRDGLQKERMEAIDRVRLLEQQTVDYHKENRNELDQLIHLDETDLRRRLFDSDNFCFVIQRFTNSRLNCESTKIYLGR